MVENDTDVLRMGFMTNSTPYNDQGVINLHSFSGIINW